MYIDSRDEEPDGIGAVGEDVTEGHRVERQPKTSMEAAKLADDYHLARKGQDGDIKHNGKAPMKPGIKCLKCGKIEHSKGVQGYVTTTRNQD